MPVWQRSGTADLAVGTTGCDAHNRWLHLKEIFSGKNDSSINQTVPGLYFAGISSCNLILSSKQPPCDRSHDTNDKDDISSREKEKGLNVPYSLIPRSHIIFNSVLSSVTDSLARSMVITTFLDAECSKLAPKVSIHRWYK